MMLRGQRSFSSGALIKRLSHRRLNRDHVPCKSVPSFWRAIGKVPENGLNSIFITPPRNVGYARAGTPARPDLNEPTMTSHGCERVRHCAPPTLLGLHNSMQLQTAEIFGEWLANLRDDRARGCITDRMDRARDGNFGQCEPTGEGVSEMKIDYGPGYRVYFFVEGHTVVVLLCGGDKRTQINETLN